MRRGTRTYPPAEGRPYVFMGNDFVVLTVKVLEWSEESQGRSVMIIDETSDHCLDGFGIGAREQESNRHLI